MLYILNLDNLLDYIKKRYIGEDIDSITWKNFYTALNEMTIYTEKLLIQDRNTVKIYHIGVRHPMCCWMIDDKEAIFGYMHNESAIHTLASEIAFLTNDNNIVGYISTLVDNIKISFEEKVSLSDNESITH